MYTPTILATTAVALSTLTLATPLHNRQTAPTNFLLVTTTSCDPALNSSTLANVSATSLFDPFDQSNHLLRLIQPGYGSLPRFNLTNGDLNSLAPGVEAVGTYVYNSTGVVTEGEELTFSAAVEPKGNLGLRSGYLVTVGGEGEGWTICDGPLGEPVVSSRWVKV
jgi:hypothetical protein